MENKKALGFFSTLILSCFITQSNAFLGLKKYKLMNKYTDKSLFNTSKFVINATKLVYSQEGLKQNDTIYKLPGQPKGIKFNQYGGYVTVDQKTGRALYYYFVEAQNYAQATLPLVLWLNGGPGCSSLIGAMQELGPFRVKSDGKTLFLNEYAWNKAANVLFLESPAGVGFSYSKTKADYTIGGDKKTAKDNFVFLKNWLERFPEYKNRDFYIAGESYAGHYVPQLAHIILINQNKTNKLIVKFKGIIIGNAVLNDKTDTIGMLKYWASHALITEDIAKQTIKYCVINSTFNLFKCNKDSEELGEEFGNIDIYNIYAPICLSNNLTDTTPKPTSIFDPDPCSDNYVYVYMNRADVQKALHANITNIPYDWTICSRVLKSWTDSPVTVLPLLNELLKHGLRVWVFSGDVDGVVPVTSTQLSIKKMKLDIQNQWRPWYLNNEVGGYTQDYGGYTQEYKSNLTFVTVRGAGHQVPTYKPKVALALIKHFLDGKKLPVT